VTFPSGPVVTVVGVVFEILLLGGGFQPADPAGTATETEVFSWPILNFVGQKREDCRVCMENTHKNRTRPRQEGL